MCIGNGAGNGLFALGDLLLFVARGSKLDALFDQARLQYADGLLGLRDGIAACRQHAVPLTQVLLLPSQVGLAGPQASLHLNEFTLRRTQAALIHLKYFLRLRNLGL